MSGDSITISGPLSKRLSKIQWHSEIAKLHLEGHRPQVIAVQLGIPVRSVRSAIEDIEDAVLREARGYFQKRIRLYLKSSLDTAMTQVELLGDDEFLTSAEPERITAISDAHYQTTERTLVLLAAFGEGQDAIEADQGDAGSAIDAEGAEEATRDGTGDTGMAAEILSD